jgi:hypothetical protein
VLTVQLTATRSLSLNRLLPQHILGGIALMYTLIVNTFDID